MNKKNQNKTGRRQNKEYWKCTFELDCTSAVFNVYKLSKLLEETTFIEKCIQWNNDILIYQSMAHSVASINKLVKIIKIL